LSEPVAETPEAESQPVPTAPATPSGEDAATLLKRLAGKDQAYTRLKTDYEATATEVAQLREFKRQAELAKLTDAERIAEEKKDLASRLAAAEAKLQRAELRSKYPKAFGALGDDAPLSETALEKIEKTLAAQADETDDEPYVDPNSPRRVPPAPKKRTLSETKKALIAGYAEFAAPQKWASTIDADEL
jgi:hypothetical protein